MSFIELLKVIALGVIEGITEWLPVSSTGHMIILNDFLKLNVTDEYWSMFEVIIQLGAILAVVVLYWRKIWPFALPKNNGGSVFKKDSWQIWFRVLVAVIPAAVLGFLLDDWLDAHLYNYLVVAVTLILYGVWFIIMERKPRKAVVKDVSGVSFLQAFKIGMFQVLSLIPGTSRSGSMIIGGRTVGLSRPAATEFSFWTAIPVMFGASLLKALKFKGELGLEGIVYLAVGMVTAFLVSYFSISFLVSFVKKHKFTIFGYYRIALGILVIAYHFLKH